MKIELGPSIGKPQCVKFDKQTISLKADGGKSIQGSGVGGRKYPGMETKRRTLLKAGLISSGQCCGEAPLNRPSLLFCQWVIWPGGPPSSPPEPIVHVLPLLTFCAFVRIGRMGCGRRIPTVKTSKHHKAGSFLFLTKKGLAVKG